MELDTAILLAILLFVIKKSRPEKFRGGDLMDYHLRQLLR